MEIGLWAMLGGAMLLLRAGLAIYLCGASRSKNALSTIFRSIAELAVGILAFWAIGDAIDRHAPGAMFFRYPPPARPRFLSRWSVFSPPASPSPPPSSAVAPVVSMLGAFLWAGIVTPLAWHHAWDGWLHRVGFVDCAGSCFVHFSAAMAALAGVIFIGPRQGKYNRDGSTNVLLGHHGVSTSIGLLLMLAIWPIYVVGCALLHGAGDEAASAAAFNTILAGSAGAALAMIFTEIRFRKLDVLLIYFGLLGGLTAVTGGADQFSSPQAALVGALAGVIAPWAAMRLDLVWKIDDPSGFIAVCTTGGIIGTLATALLSPGQPDERIHLLGVQCVGLTAIGAISFAISAAAMLALKSLGRLRVSDADEFDGLDLAEHDMNAYPDFQQTTIKSYHTREI